jgi:hypothetical protein
MELGVEVADAVQVVAAAVPLGTLEARYRLRVH